MKINSENTRSFFRILLSPSAYPLEKRTAFIKEIKGDCHWNQWLRQGGLYSFFQYYISKATDNAIEIPLFSQKEMAANFSKHLMSIKNLKEIKKILRSRSIPFYLIKGPLYSERYYPSPGLRSYGDLDIFIFPRHIQQAISIFDDLKWDMKNKEILHKGDHITLSKGRCVLELHWQLSLRSGSSPLFLIPEKILKRNTKLISIKNEYYLTFNDEIHFLHSCLNWLKKQGWPPSKYLDLYFIKKKAGTGKILSFARSTNEKKLIKYFVNELNYYFSNTPTPKKKSPKKIPLFFHHEHTGKSPTIFYLLTIQYLLSKDILSIPRRLFRNIFPQKSYLVKYYQREKRIYISWWFNKAQGLFHKARPNL